MDTNKEGAVDTFEDGFVVWLETEYVAKGKIQPFVRYEEGKKVGNLVFVVDETVVVAVFG